jgi:hypothetical protein
MSEAFEPVVAAVLLVVQDLLNERLSVTDEHSGW